MQENATAVRHRFEGYRQQLLREHGLHIWAPIVIDGDSLFKSLHMTLEGEGEGEWQDLRTTTIAYMQNDPPSRRSVVWHARAAGAYELRDQYDGRETRLPNEAEYLETYFK